MSDDQLAQQDIALVNLVCASGLPPTESLDIPRCLETIDEWTEYVLDPEGEPGPWVPHF